jgi:hypothetical protein
VERARDATAAAAIRQHPSCASENAPVRQSCATQNATPLEAENGLVFGEEDEGGDAVCWLGALCPECGAMPSGESDRCWRCGAERPDEEHSDQAT